MPKRNDINSISIPCSPFGGERSRPRAQHKGRDVGGVLTARARQMRKIPTDAEKKLWAALSKQQLGVRFRRQHPMGKRYIADFICLEKKLIIEIDGSQHAECQQSYDAMRSAFLNQEEYRVVRFWNHDVLHNIQGVVETIRLALPPHASNGADRLFSAAPPQGGSKEVEHA